MYVLRIEHHVSDFDRWKKSFDDDPIGRKKVGVRSHQVFRAIDDPKYVMVDLEFDSTAEAEDLLAALRILWGKVQGNIMTGPQARIVEVLETRSY
jgi:hypothetical protein